MTPERFDGLAVVDIIHYPEETRPARWHQPVLALGNFDGMHRGHQRILERVCRRAGERGATPVAMTFDPHPTRIVRPDKAPMLLMTKAQKLEAMARAGIEGVVIVRFTHELSHWDPERFVRTVLAEWLRVTEVWVGANFLFGHQHSGNFSLLRNLGSVYNFRAEKIDAVLYKEFVVSSTRIRRLIGEGRVDEASALLGHHYFIDGTVIHGDERGRTLGFPTVNMSTENELVPPNGVYATTVAVDDSDVVHPSVTNIGVRPTFGKDGRVSIETHIFDIGRDVYDHGLRLAFVRRLRDERTFATVDALRAQIEADCREARQLFSRISL